MVGLSSSGSGRSAGFGRASRSRPGSYDNYLKAAATSEGLKSINGFLELKMRDTEETCPIVAHLFEECSKEFGHGASACKDLRETLSQYCQEWSGRGKVDAPKPISTEELDAKYDAYMKNMDIEGCGVVAKLFEECASRFGSGDHDSCAHQRTTWVQYCRDKVDGKKGAYFPNI